MKQWAMASLRGAAIRWCWPALALCPLPGLAAAQDAPIIDMHLHAHAADANRPPPITLCLPLLEHLPPLQPVAEGVAGIMADPPCANPSRHP